MGNTQKPTRKQFENCYFSPDDSILNASEVSFIKPQSMPQRSQNSYHGQEEEYSRESPYDYGSQIQTSTLRDRHFNVLPPNILERKDSFQNIFKKKSKNTSKESTTEASMSSSRDLMKILTFVQNSIHLWLPNADFIEEASDHFLTKTHCLLGTEKQKFKSQGMKGVTQQGPRGLERQVIEGTDSRYDEEEFLRQLKCTDEDREPVSPLNLSKEGYDNTEFRENKTEKDGEPLNRTQLFAQCFLDLDENDEDDLLSPIKPIKEQPKVYKEAFDRGSLEVVVKPRSSKQQSIDVPVPLIEEYEEETSSQNGNNFKFRYFNRNPFDKLFQDLTNTPALEGKRLMDCIENDEKTESDISLRKTNVKLPPSGKENRANPSRTDNKAGKSNNKQSSIRVITLDLTETAGNVKRDSFAKDSQYKRSSNSSITAHSNDRKKPIYSQQPGKNLIKKQNQKSVKPQNRSSHQEESHREASPVTQNRIAHRATPLNTENPTQSRSRLPANAKTKSGLHHFESGHGLAEDEDESPRAGRLVQHEAKPSIKQGKLDCLTPEEEAFLRSRYFAGRQVMHITHKQGPGASVEGDGNCGHTESRREMAKLMQSYQMDSEQKPSDNRSQQSDGLQKKIAVNIHKLSQQAMMELQDFE